MLLILRFCWQKEKLETLAPTFEIEGVSAAREGTDGTEFLVHWVGGTEMWGDGATTWQTLSTDAVLAVWEKLAERESVLSKLESAGSTEIAPLQSQLAELPQVGSSGIVDSWISARIRGHWSKGEVKQYMGPPSHHFKIKFEEFKQGQADQDDGIYDLLGVDFDWRFASAPEPTVTVSTESTRARGRVARRNRQ